MKYLAMSTKTIDSYDGKTRLRTKGQLYVVRPAYGYKEYIADNCSCKAGLTETFKILKKLS